MLTHPALLVVDEIGYLPVSQDGAVLFFQLINARHERASTVLTSNKGFEEWGHVLGDEVMAAALIDRLLHHCHIVNIRGNSYRMREHQHWLRTASDEQREGSRYVTAGSAASRRVLARTPVAPLPASSPTRPTGITGRMSAPAETSSPKSVQFSVAIDSQRAYSCLVAAEGLCTNADERQRCQQLTLTRWAEPPRRRVMPRRSPEWRPPPPPDPSRTPPCDASATRRVEDDGFPGPRAGL